MKIYSGVILVLAAGTAVLPAQTFERTATITGGGTRDSGHCFVDVIVDGHAQVILRGDRATLTNQQGQPPQFRRFECTSPMPRDVRGFQFRPVNGRGRQDLVRDPRNGSDAVIEIDDREGGASNYSFEVSWGGWQGPAGRPEGPGYGPESGYGRGPGYPPPGRGYGRERSEFTTDQAIRVCQDAIRDQASQRFRTNDIRFRNTRIDDNPGRNDWVLGTLEVRRPYRRDLIMRFSCSVNFQTGRVRSADIDQSRYEEPRY